MKNIEQIIIDNKTPIRSSILHLRVKEHEKANWKQLARSYGITLSNLVEIALNDLVKNKNRPR